MTKKIQVATDLSLPLDVVTQTIAILAKRRAGKSYAMRRIAEQLFTAGQQIVIVDPKGDQWGIRGAADGRGPGLPIVILGGERGDVPLEASSGEIVAKLVVEERVSVLLDLSLFRKHEVATFMTAFMENLYRMKAREIYRTPLMLIIDEADAVAPQKPQKGEERMLGAAEDIVRRGGQRGIGCVLVTQRSAVLNKNVLTQAQILIVLRTIAPQDLAAMDAWIDVHGEADQRKTLMESLPSLPVGDAWFWSPGWPSADGIFKRVHVLPIETFDSGASPKPGVKPVEPKNLADVDLDALKGQMAATIEKAKQNNPNELHKRIADLEKQLRAKAPAAAADEKTIERAVAAAVREKAKEYETTIRDLTSRLTRLGKLFAQSFKVNEDIAGELQLASATKLPEIPPMPAATPAPTPRREIAIVRGEVQPIRNVRVNGRPYPALTDGDLGGPEQKILNELAELEALGITEPDKTQLALMAGYTNPRSGGFSEPLGRLVASGLVRYPKPGVVAITDAGRSRAVVADSPRTSEELQRRLMAKLDGPREKILRALIEIYPGKIQKDLLGQQLGYTNPRSGGFSEPLGSLRTLGLIDYPERGMVAAQPVLFLEN